MHRTHRMSRTGFSFVWFTLLSGGLLALTAQAGQPPTQPLRPAGEPLALQPPGGAAAPGQAQTAPPPKPEGEGQVRPPSPVKSLIIGIGSTQRLKMGSNKPIKTVLNPKPNVADVSVLEGDPTSVLVKGGEAGTTRLTLIDVDGREEVYDILVQFDVEYLRLLLKRAVPTANLALLPAANGVIIISGTVNKAEDIDIIMRTAQSVAGAGADRIVNAMTLGGVIQVQLDAVVALVSRSELRRMSFDFLEVGHHHNFSSTVGQAIINPLQGATLPAIPSIDINVPNVFPNAPNGAPANFFLGLFNNEQIFYGLLQILRNDNLAKILAEPKLVTMNGRSAELLSGGAQAIPETAGLGSVSVRFEPFGTRLAVLPIVLGNGKIQLEVEPEVSTIDPAVGTSISGTIVPGRDVQRVHTTVVIEDGQTLVIGGLIQHQVTATTAKTPILGDLPFLGAAFSSKSFNDVETELVVMVTPHLVDPMACNQLPHYLPGQETRNPDDCELFLEGILEAPRGPREMCPGGRYVPAYKNGPTADLYPCAGGHNGSGNCSTCGNGCGPNGVSNGTPVAGAVPGRMADIHSKPLTPIADSSNKVLPPAPEAVNKGTETAPSAPPAVLPSAEATKAPPAPVGESAAPVDLPAKTSKPFVLPSVGETSGTDEKK
jgi:pilus assembly protein CpaC